MAGKEHTTLSKRTLRLIREMKEKGEKRAYRRLCEEEGIVHANREAAKEATPVMGDIPMDEQGMAGAGGGCTRCLVLWGRRSPATGVRRGVCRRCGKVSWWQPRKKPDGGISN